MIITNIKSYFVLYIEYNSVQSNNKYLLVLAMCHVRHLSSYVL